MKTYLKGVATGVIFVFSSFIFMGQSNNKMMVLMENQAEIMKKMIIHDDMLLALIEENDTLKSKIKKDLDNLEKEQHSKNLYLTSYMQFLDEKIKIK
tara:strand:- start:188 stop:478 length:291 start_codon:yes stop_codon:yes gene_type:complete